MFAHQVVEDLKNCNFIPIDRCGEIIQNIQQSQCFHIGTYEDIENAVDLFKLHRPFSLISIVPSRRLPGFNTVRIDVNGKVYLTDSVINPFDMNASIYVYDRVWLMHGNDNHPVTEHGNGTIAYIMPEISRTDIDSLEDFLTVKARMERKNG